MSLVVLSNLDTEGRHCFRLVKQICLDWTTKTMRNTKKHINKIINNFEQSLTRIKHYLKQNVKFNKIWKKYEKYILWRLLQNVKY